MPAVGQSPQNKQQRGKKKDPEIKCDPHGSGYCWVVGDSEATKKLNEQMRDANCKLENFPKFPGGDVVAGTVAAGTLASALFDSAHVLNKTLGPIGYALPGAWLVGEGLTLDNCK